MRIGYIYYEKSKVRQLRSFLLACCTNRIKVHNLCKDNCLIRMLKCKYRKEMTLWKTKI